jgi:hypothetical protein
MANVSNGSMKAMSPSSTREDKITLPSLATRKVLRWSLEMLHSRDLMGLMINLVKLKGKLRNLELKPQAGVALKAEDEDDHE